MLSTKQLYILLGAVLIALITAGAYYFSSKVTNTSSAVRSDSSNTGTSTAVVPVTAAPVSDQVYRNETYGFKVTYPSGWKRIDNPQGAPVGETDIVTFNPRPEAQTDVVMPRIFLWTSVPKYGPVSSIAELETAVKAYFASETSNPGLSVVSKGGFIFVTAEGIPGLAGEQWAFTLVPQGVLGIYGSDGILDRFSKL